MVYLSISVHDPEFYPLQFHHAIDSIGSTTTYADDLQGASISEPIPNLIANLEGKQLGPTLIVALL